jgi:uncharacterized protein (DUF2461 family)
MPDQLRAVRAHVADHHAEFRKTFSGKKIAGLFGGLRGEPMSRPPKGYDPDHPAIDLLRYREFVLYPELPRDMGTRAEFVSDVVSRFKAATPFTEFLNAPLRRAGRKAAEENW